MIARRLPGGTHVASPEATAVAFRSLRISQTPIALMQGRGRILGTARGVSPDLDEELARWYARSQELIEEVTP